MLSLRLATNESWVDKNKEPQERTEWHTVVIWGARAEGLARVLSKGAGVLVEGTLRTSSYEKEGQKRYRTEVHAREVCFTGRRGPPGGAAPAAAAAAVGDDVALKMPARVNGFGAKKPADPLDELPY